MFKFLFTRIFSGIQACVNRTTNSSTGGYSIANEERHGLFVLYPTPSSGTADPEVDIVAVHGLNGDRLGTWTDQESGKMWLEDFLPTVITNSRIMTFGYNSAFAFSGSVSGIDDFARELLVRLRIMRILKKDRPVIFICHSLGGIVVKKALILAHEENQLYGEILSSCSGIIFMGTPHKGSDVASWAGTISSIANAASLSRPLRTDLLKNLKHNSETLRIISRQFLQRATQFPIISFFERSFTAPFSTLIVQQDSAVIGIPNEQIIPINTDHRSMCRFPHAKCQNYMLVEQAVIDLAIKHTSITRQHSGGLNDRQTPSLNTTTNSSQDHSTYSRDKPTPTRGFTGETLAHVNLVGTYPQHSDILQEKPDDQLPVPCLPRELPYQTNTAGTGRARGERQWKLVLRPIKRWIRKAK